MQQHVFGDITKFQMVGEVKVQFSGAVGFMCRGIGDQAIRVQEELR